MKAKINIIVMLMAIIFGALEASAQSANRDTRHDVKPRRVNTERQSKTKKTVNTHKSTKETNRSAVEIKRNERSSRNLKQIGHDQQNVNRNSRRNHVKVSTTNTRNPKSTYRTPEKNRYGKTYHDPKPAQRSAKSQSTIHRNVTVHHDRNNSLSHARKYYYPHRKVKIRVHPLTYHNHFRVSYYPAHREIIWTNKMYRDYVKFYPGYRWHYPIGYRIQTISAFDARFNIGEVSRVYGRVYGTWFNRETDDLLLFFGGEFPNQIFSMVIPGNIARSYNWRPEKYFLGQHIIATGLITSFEGKPEMIIKNKYQVNIY